MKIRACIVAFALSGLGGYAATAWSPPTRDSWIVAPAPTVSTDITALSGVWEASGPTHIPTRLVVEQVHDQWATILLAWGDHPEGKFARGSLRAQAKVLPDGRLFWRHLGEFTFQLSEDRTTIVARQDGGGREATVLLRKVPSGTALATLTNKIPD
jgi:hypothetical protein